VELQPAGVDRVADRTQPFGRQMRGVVQAGRVLHRQHHLVHRHSGLGGAAVRFEQDPHRRLLVVQKPVGRLGLGAVAAAGLRNAGHRLSIKVLCQDHQAPRQALIAQRTAAELQRGPARRCAIANAGGLAAAQRGAPVARQRIQPDILDRAHCPAPAILAPASRGPAHQLPIGGAITGAAVAPRIGKALHQHRCQAIAGLPVAADLAQCQGENMRGQMCNAHARQNQEAAVVDDLRQPAAPRRVIPADPRVARLDVPRRRAEAEAAETAQPTDYEVADLRSAQRTAAERVMRVHHRPPASRQHSVGSVNRFQPDPTQLRQRCLDVQLQARGRNRRRARAERHTLCRRQLDQPATLQLQQRNPTMNLP
jgi:hypothetical protein